MTALDDYTRKVRRVFGKLVDAEDEALSRAELVDLVGEEDYDLIRGALLATEKFESPMGRAGGLAFRRVTGNRRDWSDQAESRVRKFLDEYELPRGQASAVGDRIRRARIKNALTQAELGDKVGVSQMTISNWETGKASPEARQIREISAALGIGRPRVPGGSSEAGQAVDDAEAPSTFGTWLNRARVQRGLSVAELAARAGISAAAIYNLESGRIENPRGGTIDRLESALGKELPAETKREIRDEATVEGVGEFFEFDPHDRADWPDQAGIYVLYDISERPIYVGQGGSIRKRIQDHEEKFWFKSPIVTTAAYIKVEDATLRRKIETILIRFLKRNAVINKQNVER